MQVSDLRKLIIGIKGAGEMATAIAFRLYMANIRNIYMMETAFPLAVRRTVCFSECIFEKQVRVEGIEAVSAVGKEDIAAAWERGQIPVIIDPFWTLLSELPAHAVIDAVIAKKNLGTDISDAPLVIGIGPGFTAGADVHMVIESNRGHHLGRIIETGRAEADTGVPGEISGYSAERVFRAPESGVFMTTRSIGDAVSQGNLIGTVGDQKICAAIDGIIRGILRSDTHVQKGLKLGDIDPRGIADHCHTVSDKARSISGSVLEAVLRRYN